MELKRTTFIPREGDKGPLSVVLSDWSCGTREEYATHAACMTDKFWGHYFESLEEARKDFDARVQQYLDSGYEIDFVWSLDANVEDNK